MMKWFSKFFLTLIVFLTVPSFIQVAEAQEVAASIEDQVYVKPVEGLEVGLFGISPRQIIEALVNDNYQAYFANAPSRIHPTVSGDYNRFRELGLVVDLNPRENAGINQALNINSPLIFNEERSLELESENSFRDIDFTAYHGNPATNNKPFLKDTITASYYRQLSLEEQCLMQKSALEQLERLCEKITDIDQCPLDTTIPHSSLSQRELLGEIEDLDCRLFSDPEKLLTIPVEIRNALANVPFYQTNSYRLAFIVQVMRQDVEQNLFQKLFSPIEPGEDTIKVMTVIVPEPGTESNPTDDTIEYHHLSRQLFTPLEAWQIEQKTQNEEKNDRKNRSLAALNAGFKEEDLINCGNCDYGKDQEIKTALASMINGIQPSHYDKTLEKSKLIQANANLTQEKTDYNYTSGASPFGAFVNDILSQIGSIFSSVFNLGSQSKEEIERKTAEFRTYIITPADIDPNTISQIFTPLETQEAIQELERPLSVAFNEGSGDSEHSGSGETDTYEFFDPEKCDSDDPDATSAACTSSVSIDLGSFMQSIGHQIGQLTRGSIQHLTSFVPHGNKIHEAFELTIYNKNPKTDFYLKGTEAVVEEQL